MTHDLASIEFDIEWESDRVKHKDRLFIPKVNFWRDFFPGRLESVLDDLHKNRFVSVSIPPGELTEPYDSKKVYRFAQSRLRQNKAQSPFSVGRFYPNALLSKIGFSEDDVRPFRVLDNDGDHLQIDANHPLALKPVQLNVRLVEVLSEKHRRGGSGNDFSQLLTDNGPGLQAEHPDSPTDFFTGDPFQKKDSESDYLFYNQPRLVNHVDTTASSQISAIYDRFLKPGMAVLDLMASCNSHIGIDRESISVTGLGMNLQELEQNPVLSQKLIQDLNENHQLPFKDGTFDACICSLSIEYLTDPIAVFRDVQRVLKPKAPFIVTFSDRWFDTKAIQLWMELHSFERMGLVTRFFRDTGCFSELNTESVQGFPRPQGDKLIHERPESDPIFAVWGFKE